MVTNACSSRTPRAGRRNSSHCRKDEDGRTGQPVRTCLSGGHRTFTPPSRPQPDCLTATHRRAVAEPWIQLTWVFSTDCRASRWVVERDRNGRAYSSRWPRRLHKEIKRRRIRRSRQLANGPTNTQTSNINQPVIFNGRTHKMADPQTDW
jgi:hypothetical protein